MWQQEFRRSPLVALSAPVVILAVIASLVAVVSAYPSGAPQGTCDSLVPHHGVGPQDLPAPYGVAPARPRTEEGRVRLKLSSHQGVPFTGFLLQARDSAGRPIGFFTELPDASQHLACGETPKASATHNNATRKKSLDFEWEAPADYEGSVVFNATVVQDFATFWVGITSDPVQVVKRSSEEDFNTPPGSTAGPAATPDRTTRKQIKTTTPGPTTKQAVQKSAEPEDPIYDGCGINRSCFGTPEGCVASKDCQGVVSVLVRGERYEFEMKASNAVYVALGLSDDNKMGGDSVVECVGEPGRVAAYMSWNIENGKNNRRSEEQDGVKLINGSYINGNIYCKYSRALISTVENREFNLGSQSYFLLLAAGSSLRDNGVGFHDKFYVSSGEKRSLADTAGFSADSKLFLRLHGAFMLTSWIGAASIGIVLARYYKQTWVGSRLCGKDQWFVWHRFFMVLVWLLTIAGFVLIFIEVGGWTADTQNPHSILGAVTTALAFIQPIGAAMRPTPSSPKRPLFNWLHWLVGNSAHIIAIVTIFFAPVQKAELPEWMDEIVVAYVAFYVFIHLFLSISGLISDRAGRKRVNSFPMKEMNSGRIPMHSADRTLDAPYSGLRRFMLGLHIIVIVLLTAALVLIVVFAPIENSWKKLLKTLNLS